jgi:hypothetical protein
VEEEEEEKDEEEEDEEEVTAMFTELNMKTWVFWDVMVWQFITDISKDHNAVIFKVKQSK